MFSLQRLLGKDDKFFDLLEASAEQVVKSVSALMDLLSQPDPAKAFDVFVQTRRKSKQISEEISAQLCRTFVTPLEREDIEALSAVLYKIPKTVEKFGERLLLCRQRLPLEDFARQARMLEDATLTLQAMVAGLRRKPRLEKVKDQNECLQHLEGEADKLMLEVLRDLYSGRHDALQVVIRRNLYELLEKIIDRCRDAGNVIFHIVLKHS